MACPCFPERLSTGSCRSGKLLVERRPVAPVSLETEEASGLAWLDAATEVGVPGASVLVSLTPYAERSARRARAPQGAGAEELERWWRLAVAVPSGHEEEGALWPRRSMAGVRVGTAASVLVGAPGAALDALLASSVGRMVNPEKASAWAAGNVWPEEGGAWSGLWTKALASYCGLAGDPAVAACLGRDLACLEAAGAPVSAAAAACGALESAVGAEGSRGLSLAWAPLALVRAARDLDPAALSRPGDLRAAPGRWNDAQLAAVTDPSPLLLLRAGAGCGKSTVLKGRVAALVEAGAEPSRVCCLSFTNAAADHVASFGLGCASETLDGFAVRLHRALHPDQAPVEPATLASALEAAAASPADVRRRLAGHVRRCADGTTASLMALWRLVEAETDACGAACDEVAMCSLELACCMAAAELDRSLPQDPLPCSHLLVDEVQDDSPAQTLLLLRYARSRGCSLFMVGDPGQTLYAFRGADARAMDALEASGAFSCLALTVNYRSDQTILDLANRGLARVESETSCSVRLTSGAERSEPSGSDSAAATGPGYAERVRLVHERVPSRSPSAVADAIGRALWSDGLGEWVRERAEAGEKVAFLAPWRSDVAAFAAALPAACPGLRYAPAMVERARPLQLVAPFVRDCWDEAEALVSDSPVDAISHLCWDRCVANGAPDEQLDELARLLDEWRAGPGEAVEEAWAEEGRGAALAVAKRTLLAAERDADPLAAEVGSERGTALDVEAVLRSADVVGSTVHSAKGLEFDAVVLLVDADARGQEAMRAEYVGLTRARRHEFVLTVGRADASEIQRDHEEILASLGLGN